ncbi:hypothetical protein CHJ35_09710 [Listeria monocytogenes]|nr:hypothetical protein [Listeria monocytogenes]EAE3604586.1 hypothetical protein [Listeria monocytogenes]EAE3636113.1 hypothetical protein [Listeria monocytogenes]EAE3642358.1 hypothetical protein [Listeria monocytogenes]EAE3647671.1 hypothetical protein [Listeria monocytogenes]
MWVLMKNGIVDVEATNAYNAAVLNGELSHESNEAQEEAELLQAVIQSVKEGIDPVTGQEISKAQGFSIISGFIFYYTAGGYKGKKIKIPKKWLDRRRNVNRIDFLQSVNIKDFVVKDKHLRNSTAKRARKFDAETSKEANLIVQDALKNGKVKKIEDNGLGSQRQKSYSAIIDTEKNVGTKGESHIKIVYDELNNVWTVYPVPAP